MKCQNCGFENSPESKFCMSCGSKLQEQATNTNIPMNNETNQNNFNQLMNNGMNQNNFNQPMNNGMNQNNFNQSTNNNMKQNNNNKTLIIVIVSIVVGLVVLFFATRFILTQIAWHITDKSLTEEASHINDGFDTNSSQSNDSSTSKTEKYSVGDAVTLVDGSSWHVIGYNTSGQVKLLLDKLVVETTGYGPDGTPASQLYANSNVKQYVENTYLPTLKTSLNNAGGDTSSIKARLITAQEFMDVANNELSADKTFSSLSFDGDSSLYYNNKKWLMMTKTFWTMTNVRDVDSSNKLYGAYAVLVGENTVSLWTDYSAQGDSSTFKGSYLGIRPLIEINASNIK